MWPTDAQRAIDWLSLALALLLGVLLYRISLLAMKLKGEPLVRAIKSVEAHVQAMEASRAGHARRRFGLDSITPAQRSAVERVRSECSLQSCDLEGPWEPLLLRHLLRCDWSEDEALRRLKQTARWRLQNCASEARRRIAAGWQLSEHPHFEHMVASLGLLPMHRRTYAGGMLTIVTVGGMDTRACTEEDFSDLLIHLIEFLSYQADRLSQEKRVLVHHDVLCDCEGLDWEHLDSELLLRMRRLAAILEAHYPELMASVSFVHVPSHFIHLWSALEPGLPDLTRASVCIADTERTSQMLSRLAPRASLPTAMGGTCKNLPADVRSLLGINHVRTLARPAECALLTFASANAHLQPAPAGTLCNLR